jgi:UPF0755 protein
MTRKIILVVLLIVLTIVGYFAYQIWLSPGGGEPVLVRIPEGSSFDAILDSLDRGGLISSRAAFKMLAKATGGDSRIKPGTYKFQQGIASAELLQALVEGRSTVKVKLTFPEGITIRRVASIASRQIGCDSAELVHMAEDRPFLKTIGINAPSAEGYLMPDTYYVPWGEKPATLLRRMADQFLRFYNDSLKSRAAAQGLSPYEAVILASIVEGEAKVDQERPVIAGLYLNRLRQGIKLAADPTVQYILPDGPRRLLFKDLKIESPYNTYLNKGLPPTPINNPGRASIMAALNPDKNDYLFMVAKADGSGRHTFSRTASEHEAAVKEYYARRDSQ